MTRRDRDPGQLVWRLLFATIGTLLLVWAVGRAALALDDDPAMSLTSRAASLTVPYDLTEKNGQNRVSFIRLTAPGAKSPDDVLGEVPKVAVHLAAYTEDCRHEADMWLCVTRDSTITVDPAGLTSLHFDPDTKSLVEVGPKVDLSGERGVITLTAYETDRACSPGGGRLVDDALIGAWSISDNTTSATCSGPAFGHGLDESGSFVQLNEPGYDFDRVSVGTYNPSLIEALDIGIVLQEEAGQEPGELGPIVGEVNGRSRFCDGESEVCISRPDLRTTCVYFDEDPEPFDGSGYFDLHKGTFTAEGDTEAKSIGSSSRTAIYAVRCEDFFSLGMGTFGNYTRTTGEISSPTDPGSCTCEPRPIVGGVCLEDENVICTPDPEPTPEPTSDPAPTNTLAPLPTATPAATAEPTPEPTPIPTPTPDPTPQATASPEPTAPPTPEPTSTPTPTGIFGPT